MTTLFETAIFEANFFYLPRRWDQPEFTVMSSTPDEAWKLHAELAVRFTHEFPGPHHPGVLRNHPAGAPSGLRIPPPLNSSIFSTKMAFHYAGHSDNILVSLINQGIGK